MENIKEFFVTFWGSKFNKIWVFIALAVFVFIAWGKKTNYFRSASKKKLPVILVAIVIVLFFLKKIIIEKFMSNSDSPPPGSRMI